LINCRFFDVDFNYDTGMYRIADVLAIYYEFASVTPGPLPFIDNGRDNFTPEM
jgi:hypothetical protein